MTIDKTIPVELVNKVAQSGIISFDLETYFPDEKRIVSFDMKDYLFKGLILREKDFREALAAINWEDYTGKYLAIFCSADAISFTSSCSGANTRKSTPKIVSGLVV